jgi:SAM-dependent methyltransferase
LAYDLFAPVYDHFFGPEAASDTRRALDRLLFRDLVAGSSVVDLCCGTGQLTEVLVKLGYRASGVDISAGMLERAKQRLPEVEFVQADIREYRANRQYDAVISAYNSLVHLVTPEDLLRALKNVLSMLNGNGVFIFDLYSEEAYRRRWRGSFSKVDAHFACIVRASYDPALRLGENLATIFYENHEHAQTPGNSWTRADVRIVSRCYADSELNDILHRAGFDSIECFEAASQLGLNSAAGRVFWRCRAHR